MPYVEKSTIAILGVLFTILITSSIQVVSADHQLPGDSIFMDQDLRVNHKRPLVIDSGLIQIDELHCRKKSLTEAIRLKQLFSCLSSAHGKCQS